MSELIKAGQMDDAYETDGRVYDEMGISPTIRTVGGGVRILTTECNPPKINVVGLLSDGVYAKMHDCSRRVYHENGISPTVNTAGGGNLEIKVMVKEPCMLTTKRNEYGKAIRKEYEAGNIKEKRKNIRNLEPRNDGVANTITSNFSKENLVAEPEIIKVCNANPSNSGMNGNVYSDDGISPAITTNKGEGYKIIQDVGEPEVVSINPKKDDGTQTYQQDRIYKTDGIMTSLTAELGGRHNIIEDELPQEDCSQDMVVWGGLQKNQTPRVDGVCPSINAAAGMGGGHTPIVAEQNSVQVQVVGNTDDNYEQNGRIYADKGVSPTLSARDYKGPKKIAESDESNETLKNSRIRKLTPLECWRLMDFGDDDFYKAQKSGVSNSQLYKQAGNSICVGVLEAIFGQMFNGENVV